MGSNTQRSLTRLTQEWNIEIINIFWGPPDHGSSTQAEDLEPNLSLTGNQHSVYLR